MKRVVLLLGIFLVVSALFACAPKSVPIEKPVSPERAVEESKAFGKEAWEVEWERTLDLARKEGKVVVYMEGAIGALVKDPIMTIMKEKFWLVVEILPMVSAELSAKVLRERKAGLLYNDIIITGGGSMTNTLKPEGMFGTLEPTFILPEVKDAKNWRDGKLPWFDKEKKVLRTVFAVLEGATINTTIVKKEDLKSYRDLLDPRWKGRIVMFDPTIPGKGQAVFQTILKLMGEDFLIRLSKQDIILSRDHRQLAEWLAHGKYTIGLAVHDAYTQEMIKIGVPLDFVLFEEGAIIHSPGAMLGIMESPPHPNASRIFINWLLSREGKTLFSQISKYVSWRVDVPTEHMHSYQIPKPGVRYLDDPEEWYRAWTENMKLAREILVLRTR